MKLSRRDFLKASGAFAALTTLGFDVSPVSAQVQELRIKSAKITPTICPYCSVGCGLRVHTDASSGKLLYTDGDPDHPINQGTMCSKGASVFQLNSVEVGKINPKRLTKPLYRPANGDSFKEVEWDWALDNIAKRIKETRNATFTATKDGMPVMRTEAIANFGGAGLDNEECYLLQKLARSLGLIYIEHQARI